MSLLHGGPEGFGHTFISLDFIAWLLYMLICEVNMLSYLSLWKSFACILFYTVNFPPLVLLSIICVCTTVVLVEVVSMTFSFHCRFIVC